MTFLEAFNTGCRFKLPVNYGGQDKCWPDGFWWAQHSPGHIKILYSYAEVIHSLEEIASDRELAVDMSSNDWFLHPEDEQRMKFNNKLQEVINDTQP